MCEPRCSAGPGGRCAHPRSDAHAPGERRAGAPEPRTAGVGGGSRAFRGYCDRPAAVKRACDPDDFFRVNQNIPPA
ncbi:MULTISPECIES: BBE domain-containing protein [unclassified Streptomyces]|uniref:BBE domain-containing protein n=1 Tax=unclassified Streptomyces TaxID=2593676 RepID=UPI00331E89FE